MNNTLIIVHDSKSFPVGGHGDNPLLGEKQPSVPGCAGGGVQQDSYAKDGWFRHLSCAWSLSSCWHRSLFKLKNWLIDDPNQCL